MTEEREAGRRPESRTTQEQIDGAALLDMGAGGWAFTGNLDTGHPQNSIGPATSKTDND